MFDRIPSELRSLRQWVLHDKDKRPFQINGEYADVTSPVTWNSFDAVCAALNNNDRFTGIGFVFTESDPYSGIDLDYTENQEFLNRHKLIYEILDSYSEISPSGKGLHIIVKGKIPSSVRRDKVEIYSSGRYFTMTGNVCDNKITINERNELLNQLYNEIKTKELQNANTSLDDTSERYTDDEITIQCSKAINGDKFDKLFRGEWAGIYPSQSEADFALIDIIAFYTQSRRQIIRLFHKSKLGQRTKAKRQDYLNWMINKSFDRIIPPVDIAPLQEAIKQKLEGSFNGRTPPFEGENLGSNPSPSTIPIPPGLLGEIAKFIYAAAPRPIPEIAMAAAIGLMAGICGRAYNISGSGLNQYVLLLAPTGMGKEAISSGIDKIMSAIFTTNPASKDFVGPSDMASGQALVRYIDDSLTKCFVCMMDEFGLRLQSMSDPKANDAQRKLKQTLLELYQRTGRGQIFRPTIYADKQKNTLSTPCPNVTILGYSAPERFYEVLSEDMIVDGVLPRFSIIEYKGMRPPHNYDFHTVMPSSELVKQVGSLAIHSLSQMSNVNTGQQWVTIQIDDAAEKMHREFNTYCDSIYNSSAASSHKQLWSRAHLKALKLAGLIAVGCNMYSPVVITEHLEYAIKMVCNDIRAMLAKFETGGVGRNNLEVKQIKEIARVMSECIQTPWERNKKYFADAPQQMHYDKIVPYCYINKRLSGLAVMNDGKLKASIHIKHAIQVMLEIGMIIELDKEKVAKNYNCNYKCFIIKDLEIL